MSAGYKIGYQVMYRLGITPWVHGEPAEPLAALIEGPRSLPPARTPSTPRATTGT
jgi:hypothetical protein